MATEDQNTQTDTATPEAQGPSIQVVAQYIKDMSLENPNSPASIVGGWGAPETNVQINIRTQQLKDDMHEATLMFRIEARVPKQENKVAFIIELAYAATVQLKNVQEDNVSPVLMIEVPKLIFPFAREVIADATVKAGFPPLYMQPISFEAIYAQDVQRRAAEAQNGAENNKKNGQDKTAAKTETA
jgi:preprotein translocase subunit SecB